VADQNTMVRLGLRTVLEREPDIAVVAEAADCAELLDRAERLTPDVVLLDVRLPGLNDFAIPTPVMESAGVVVVSAADDRASIAHAVGAGALSYLVHGQFDVGELAVVVRRAAAGQSYLTPSASAAVVEYFRQDAALALRRDLTARERQVMDLVAQGLSNQDVAHQLAVSIKTVKNHLHQVFRQLKVTDRRSASDVWRRRSVNSSPVANADLGADGS
jgi:DNA-binding NarL/FixJ family response regulator